LHRSSAVVPTSTVPAEFAVEQAGLVSATPVPSVLIPQYWLAATVTWSLPHAQPEPVAAVPAAEAEVIPAAAVHTGRHVPPC